MTESGVYIENLSDLSGFESEDSINGTNTKPLCYPAFGESTQPVPGG